MLRLTQVIIAAATAPLVVATTPLAAAPMPSPPWVVRNASLTSQTEVASYVAQVGPLLPDSRRAEFAAMSNATPAEVSSFIFAVQLEGNVADAQRTSAALLLNTPVSNPFTTASAAAKPYKLPAVAAYSLPEPSNSTAKDLFCVAATKYCRGWRATVVSALLLAHAVDVVTYKIEQETLCTPKANGKAQDLFRLNNYAYQPERNAIPRTTPRAQLLRTLFTTFNTVDSGSCAHAQATLFLGEPGRGEFQSFVCDDIFVTGYQGPTVSTPVYRYFRIWNPSTPYKAFFGNLQIPDSRFCMNASGVTAPKLQLFPTLHMLSSDKDIETVLLRGLHGGNMAFSATNDVLHPDNNVGSVEQGCTVALSDEAVTNASMSVTKFSYDSVELTVENPLAMTGVLYYADCWHPDWRGYVNGARTHIFRANIAYKAIFVPPGRSEVQFRFGTIYGTVLLYAMLTFVLATFVSVVYVLARALPLSQVITSAVTDRMHGALWSCGVVLCAVAMLSVVFSPCLRRAIGWLSLSRPLNAAIDHVDGLIADKPDDTRRYLERGRLCQQRGDMLNALSDYSRVIDLDPSNIHAFISRSEVWSALHNGTNANADLRCVLSLDPSNTLSLSLMGHEWDKALQEASALIAREPFWFGHYIRRAELRLNANDNTGAVADITKAIRMSPCISSLYLMRARAYAFAGDRQGAIHDCGTCLQLDPYNTNALQSRAALYASRGQLSKSIEDYSRALRIDPSNGIYRSNLFAVQNWLAHVGSSSTAFVATDAKLVNMLRFRASEHYRHGDWNGLIDDLTGLIEIEPSATNYNNRATIYVRLGKYDDAIRDYQAALAIAPDIHDIRTDLAYAIARKMEDSARLAGCTGVHPRIDYKRPVYQH